MVIYAPDASAPNRIHERPSERVLCALWQRAHTLSEGLITEDGRPFRVVYPGRANPREGPDFRDAIITTESGDTITGDVELHLKAPDWYSHRHHADPNYNGVILHVVLWPKRESTSKQQSGTKTPVASVAHAMPFLSCAEDSTHSLVAHLGVMDKRGLEDALDRAGDERFLARSRGFAMELAATDPDQVLYGALMEALGYQSNRRPFRELAQRVPICSLSRLRDEPPVTRLLAMEATLLGAAGMLSYLKPSIAEEAQQIKGLHKRLPRSRAMSPKHWQLFRVRPANHPVRRIIGAAYLVDRCMDTGLVRGLEEDVRRGDAVGLTERLTVRPYIGNGRARDLVINAVLPFLHAYSELRRSPALGRRCIEIYHAFPKLEDNEITREMKRLLELEAKATEGSGARRQQGLIHLYKSLAVGPSAKVNVALDRGTPGASPPESL